MEPDMPPSSLCVIQARMGSSRLPGKVLQPLDGVPMLEFMLRRLSDLEVDRVVVATSDLDRDDPIAVVARGCGIAVIRGSETDVLNRYMEALDTYPSEIVVRLTADCPLTDPRIVEAVVATHCDRGADYTSNVFPRSYPKGLDVEVITSSALRTAAASAVDPLEREHVTPYLYRHPELFKLANHDSGLDAGAERWTVDTPQDLELVRSLVKRVGRSASWPEILATVGRTPQPVIGGEVKFRVARCDDSARVLAWRNDPDSVRWSTTRQPVDSDCHRRWFREVIQHPGHRLLIAEFDGRSVGYVRLDICDGSANLSIAVDPRCRGRGVGKAMLKTLVGDLAHDVQISRLTATVHRDNVASFRAFASVGFREAVVSENGFVNLVWNS